MSREGKVRVVLNEERREIPCYLATLMYQALIGQGGQRSAVQVTSHSRRVRSNVR